MVDAGNEPAGGTAPPSLPRGGVVEELILGSRDIRVIDRAVDQLCSQSLGAGVATTLFRATSVGAVFGVMLTDGRAVVVKAHQPRESRATLQAVHNVQRHLHQEGFPCPAPLVGPIPLGRGLALVEEYAVKGEYRDTHHPKLRRVMAESLAWHLDLTRACSEPSALGGGWNLYTPEGLWPSEAHAPMFNFDATAAGTEWIDAIATKAKPLATMPGEPIVGHTDWSGKHFRFHQGEVSVVYDWDSLRLRSEAQIVGNAAMTFTTNFDLAGQKLTPTPEEVRAFIDEYSAARVAPLTLQERTQISACATFIAAYTVRCEHCRPGGYDPDTDRNSFTAALREHGIAYLKP